MQTSNATLLFNQVQVMKHFSRSYISKVGYVVMLGYLASRTLILNLKKLGGKLEWLEKLENAETTY